MSRTGSSTHGLAFKLSCRYALMAPLVHFGALWCTLVHFGAVVADAPSPLSTPRCATGQAQLRLGKPLRMKCRASPVLLFMRAGRVVAGRVGSQACWKRRVGRRLLLTALPRRLSAMPIDVPMNPMMDMMVNGALPTPMATQEITP